MTSELSECRMYFWMFSPFSFTFRPEIHKKPKKFEALMLTCTRMYLLIGATFGTGITAIKLTALGRPQLLVRESQTHWHKKPMYIMTRCSFSPFQLQLSEVIMHARNYMMDMVGGEGNVLSHHKTIEDLEHYYQNKIGHNEEIQEFLKNVTSDNEG